MNFRLIRQSLSWLAASFLLAVSPAPTFAALPDPVRFGARMEMGDVAVAREWLDEGLDPNFVADRVGTGLMIGAWIGSVPLMELFVARGADIHRVNGFGETALMHAAWRGQLDAVKWLIARGAKLNREGSPGGGSANPANEWSALHYAAFSGSKEVALWLIDRGANINAKSPNGSSVLMMAIYEGHDDLAATLVKRGADRTIRNENGHSALDWAVKYNRPGVVAMLGSAQEIAAAPPPPAVPPRSAAEDDDIAEMLRIRRILQSRGISLAQIDQRVAAMRTRTARTASPRPSPMPTLEITASRRAPKKQRIQLRY